MDAEFAESLAARLVSAERVLTEAERLQRVLRAMDALPKMERSVLLLSAIEEMSHTEISAVLGKSESAVRALLFRGRTRLTERLKRMEPKGGTR